MLIRQQTFLFSPTQNNQISRLFDWGQKFFEKVLIFALGIPRSGTSENKRVKGKTMKKLIIILFILSGGLSIAAQTKATRLALPVSIIKMNKGTSDKLLNNAVIKARLKWLLGKKGYNDFVESFETVNPVVKKGNFLFTSGCLIHACGHVESAIAVDLVKKTVHAGIFREGEKPKYFNERSRKTPLVIKNWATRLIQK